MADDVQQRREATTIGPQRQNHRKHDVVVGEEQRALHDQQIESVRKKLLTHCLLHHRQPGVGLAIAEVSDGEDTIAGERSIRDGGKVLELIEEGADGREDELVEDVMSRDGMRAELIAAWQLMAANVDAAELAAGGAKLLSHLENLAVDELHAATRRDG